MKISSPSEAAALVRDTDRLVVPLAPGQPPTFLETLGERESFDRLEVFTGLLLQAYQLFTRPGVRLLSGFFGAVERGLAAAGGNVEFVPGDFRRFGHMVRRLRPRIMATAAAPPGADGRCSLALHAGATVDELIECGRDPDRLLIVEVNTQLPRTLGLPPEAPHSLGEDEIDVLIETDRPVFTLPDAPPTAVERAIADHVLPFVRDGATLQCGIGGIPDAVVCSIAEGSGGDYGIHSEMFTTGLMRLHETGKVTNRKGQYDGLSISTFALGSAKLYEWLDERTDVRFLPVDIVNTPDVIARNRNFVSINGAVSVDLAGQIVADTLPGRQYSGIGGHEDFVAGASFSDQGVSLVCLPSTAAPGGRLLSRITAATDPGTTVTTPRHQAHTIVTEYGVAELAGRTVAERRDALIAIAHPDFRHALRAVTRDARPAPS
jgi:acyl-CoA hydrolase